MAAYESAFWAEEGLWQLITFCALCFRWLEAVEFRTLCRNYGFSFVLVPFPLREHPVSKVPVRVYMLEAPKISWELLMDDIASLVQKKGLRANKAGKDEAIKVPLAVGSLACWLFVSVFWPTSRRC